MNSFRVRLALLVGALTAALLLATAWAGWGIATRFSLDRLDRELRHLAGGNLDRVNDRGHWDRLHTALAFVSGGDRPRAYAIWAGRNGREDYRSPHWPASLLPEKLPVPAAYEGGVTFETPPPPPRREPISARNPALPLKQPMFVTAQADGSAWRVAVTGNPYVTLILAANLDELQTDLNRLRQRLLLALPVTLAVVGLGAWWLATRALRPIAALTRAAESVSARDLSQRIAVPAHDREFQRLASVFNAMLDRLEVSFRQATRFSADASHELKTPLALLQAELEQALNAAPAGSAAAASYTSLLEDVHRLKAIVQKLLLLSLADSGRLELHRTPTDVGRLLANISEDCAALAPGLVIEHALPAGVLVPADAVLLEQALQNLAGNAIKYNREGGLVRLELRADRAAGVATIHIGNTGPGIAPEDRPRVFERFFRGDRARSQQAGAPSAGLGLSLSREILRAHHGDLTLAPVREGGDWTEFVATVPLAAPS